MRSHQQRGEVLEAKFQVEGGRFPSMEGTKHWGNLGITTGSGWGSHWKNRWGSFFGSCGGKAPDPKHFRHVLMETHLLLRGGNSNIFYFHPYLGK